MPSFLSSSSSDSDSEDRVGVSWSDASDAVNSQAGEANSNDRSPTHQREEGLTAGGGSVVDYVRSSEQLEPKERIHRYIDRCIPPALMIHQRTTDGSILVQLCAELEELGSPNSWTRHVPATVFDEYAVGSEDHVRGIESTHPDAATFQSGPRVDLLEAAYYSCETVAHPAHPSVTELSRTAESGSASTVPWSALTRHLSYVTARLHRMLSPSHRRVGAYVLPLRFQASVVPLLYAWLTHWPLIEADVKCWRGVARCFIVSCRASILDKGFPGAKSEYLSGSTFTLPWQPLAALCLSVRDTQNAKLPSWRSALAAVVALLPSICRRASPYFGVDAVDGLWGLVASHLAPTEEGAAALSLFVRLVPYQHLCVPGAAGVATLGFSKEIAPLGKERDDNSQGRQGGGGPSAGWLSAQPQLTERAQQLLHFLLVETFTWAPPGRPSPAVGVHSVRRRQSKKSKGSQPSQKRAGEEESSFFYLTWERAVVTFAASLARAHPGLAGIDAFAEPLFTAWLQALQLPVESGAGIPGASAVAASAATVPRLARSRVPTAGSSAHKWTSVPYVRLLNAFPDVVDSPLWRQLERWVHATSVLVRPGMPCTSGSPADRVCDCYQSLASEAARLCAQKKKATQKLQTSRNIGFLAESGRQTSQVSDDAVKQSPASPVVHHWGHAAVERLVGLLLPHAVASFQARARQAQGLLCALLRLSPSTVLPEFLKCVETGLRSPTEVAAQRAASTRLLTCAVPTVLADTVGVSLSSSSTDGRAALLAFLRETLPSLLTFIDPSSLVSAQPVLSLIAVATTHAAVEEVLGSLDHVTAFAADYVSRVISLFAAHADPKDGRFRGAEVSVRACLREMPPEVLRVVTREVLREAQIRDHGARMVALVRMVSSFAPADAWSCAEKHWLCIFHDLASDDAEVQWASPLLAACVSELGDRSLVRVHAASIWRGVQMQLRFLTSGQRRSAASEVMEALMRSLVRPRASARSYFRFSSNSSNERSLSPQMPGYETDPCGRSGTGASPQPFSPPKIGTATEARAYVEWPSAVDVQVAADLFNKSLKDAVSVMQGIAAGENLNTAAVGWAVSASGTHEISLHTQLFTRDSATSTTPPGGTAALCCESAIAITPHSVLEGTLQWMQRLLIACDWMFMERRPYAGTADPQQTQGVPWWDVNPRCAWTPSGAPFYRASCRPAYTRCQLFEILYRCVCLPMLREHVVVPLRQCGVDLREWFPAATSDEAFTLADDSQAVALTMLPLLQWLSSSVVRMSQQEWCPALSFSHYLRQSIWRQCPWTRRRRPLECWVARSMQLQVEAVSHGNLPVTQKTFSSIVSVLQGLCLSPRRSVRLGAVYLLVHSNLFGSLDCHSRVNIARRVRAVATDIVCQWQSGRPCCVSEAASATVTQKLEGSPVLSSTTTASRGRVFDGSSESNRSLTSMTQGTIGGVPSAAQRIHTLQGAMEGVQTLVASFAMGPGLSDAPSACVELLRFLVCLPEELRTARNGVLLPQLTEGVRNAKSVLVRGAIRSPAFTEDLVPLAYQVAATYPARAVLLLSYAHLVYWPSPRRWVALRAVQCLTRMSLASYVALRCVAAELLHAVSVPVTVREPTWTVCTMAASVQVMSASLLLSPEASRNVLSEAEQLAYQAAVASMQECVQRLTEACPLLPYYTGTRGLVFPLRYITVPRCAAAALGLQPVQPSGDTLSSNCGATIGHSFMNAITYMQPSNAPAYRRQWFTMLVGDTGGSVAASDVLGEENPRSVDTATEQLSPCSWVLQLLSLPVEFTQVHGDAQVASPSTVVELLVSLSQDPVQRSASSALPSAASLLLRWADDALTSWKHGRSPDSEFGRGGGEHVSHLDISGSGDLTPPPSERSAVVAPTAHILANEGIQGVRAEEYGDKDASKNMQEDIMYQLFRSLAIVSSAVLRLTAPLHPAATPTLAQTSFPDVELRARAVRFFSDVVVGVCSYAAVPHRVAERVLFLAVSTLKESLTSDELGDLVCALAGQLHSAAPAQSGHASAGDVSGDGGDTWSQRQERLLFFIDTLLGGVSPAILSLTLPRLVALVDAHTQFLSLSSAGEVRQMSAAVVTRLANFSMLQSRLRTEFSCCKASADALVASLVRRANTAVLQGGLSFAGDGDENGKGLAKANSTACNDVSGDVAEAESPTPCPRSTSEDVALLTFTALCIQRCDVAIFESHAFEMLRLLCCCLDMSFTEVHRLGMVVEAALSSLMALRMPKSLVHQIIEQLCSVCLGTVPYGTSRRAKAACTRALRRLIFPNLHRIGKFAVMEQLSAASLAALMQCDSGIRADGSYLMVVLTKVAAEAQTRVLVQRLVEELRHFHHQPTSATTPAAAHQEGGASSTSNTDAGFTNRRVALVQALGAVVLADPGAPSSYVPKVMVRLATCAREGGNTECGRVAKRIFEEWWHTHREGWEHVYRLYFTLSQVDAMSDLLLAPRYYV